MNEYPETHQQGVISIENIPTMLGWDGSYMEGDLGIQIANDGRVWVCIDGIAFLRFKPKVDPRMESVSFALLNPKPKEYWFFNRIREAIKILKGEQK
jgi:hypothetical protein